MADKIQIYAGKKATMPQLLPRELGYCTDTQELFIGSVNEGNKLVGAVAWGTDISTLKTSLNTLQGNITTLQGNVTTAQNNITTLQGNMTTAQGNISTLQSNVSTIQTDITALKTDKLTANKAASVATLATDATQESIITAVNDLISSLKAAGVMSA